VSEAYVFAGVTTHWLWERFGVSIRGLVGFEEEQLKASYTGGE
jgi:hypothetical protein